MYKNDYLRMYVFDHYFDILLTNLEETGLFYKRIVAFFKRNGDNIAFLNSQSFQK